MSTSTPQLERAAFRWSNLGEVLESATEATLHAAEFGIVGLSDDGRVTFYNRYEQALAGLAESDVIGRDFCVEVAPCTNNFKVREQFVNAWRDGKDMDESLPYTFSYRMAPTQVELRMMVRGRRGWLLVLKL